jgi:hypothetical protein
VAICGGPHAVKLDDGFSRQAQAHTILGDGHHPMALLRDTLPQTDLGPMWAGRQNRVLIAALLP